MAGARLDVIRQERVGYGFDLLSKVRLLQESAVALRAATRETELAADCLDWDVFLVVCECEKNVSVRYCIEAPI